MTRSRENRLTFTVATSLVAAAGLCLAGCASKPKGSEAPAVNTGLTSLVNEPAPDLDLEPIDQALSPDDYANQVSMDIDHVLAAANAGGEEGSTVAMGGAYEQAASSPDEGWLSSLSTDPATALWTNTSRQLATMRDRLLEPTWDAIVREHVRRSQTPSERIARHVEAIATIMRTEQAGAEMDVGMLLALSAMEAVRPGMLEESVDPIELELLRPEERSTLDAVRHVVGSHGHPSLSEASQSPAERLLAAAELVWEAKPMHIRLATLARRVDGFGRYVPFESSSFVAGRPQRLIVYTEIDNFSHRPFRQSDLSSASAPTYGSAWSVEVSQQLKLYRDGAYVWGKPEQSIIETSRNRRRDFYLVHQIELPPTLTVGPYELKIIMRDKTSGEIDEAIIPFTYVADRAAASAE